MMSYQIYHLSDPRTSAVRYVGMSQDAQKRLQRHIYQKDNPNRSWLDELLQEGMKPTLTIIETVEEKQEAKERELHWITFYTEQGAHLENYQGNAQAHYKWKEYEKWHNYAVSVYGFIENPQDREYVINVFTEFYLHGNSHWLDLLNTADTVIQELQKVRDFDIDDVDFARIVAKLCHIKVEEKGSEGVA